MPKNKDAEWRRFDNLRRKWEKILQADAEGVFSEEGKLLIQSVRDNGIEGILTAWNKSEKNWDEFFNTSYTSVITASLNFNLPENNLNQDQFQTFLDLSVNSFIQKHSGQKITYVMNTTKQRVSKVIEVARQEAYTVAKVQDIISDHDKFAAFEEQLILNGIKKTYETFQVGRALTIARTEVGSASSYGQLEAGRLSGATKKTWVTARDPEVRPSHQSLEGETVGIDSLFSNGLRFPLDPAGPAGEVINCRCSLSFGL